MKRKKELRVPHKGDFDDPLYKLELERDRLEERYMAFTFKATKERNDLGFWGVVGGIGLAADWTFLGGLGTAIAVFSGASWLSYKSQAKQVGADLKKMEQKISDLNELRFKIELQNPEQKGPLRAEFSPAAKAEIDELRQKLASLQEQMSELEKPKITKPKLKPQDPPAL